MKDYYKILGLNRDSTQAQIRAAYRRLALKYHPDINSQSDAHERFIEINEAYELLFDIEKRKLYDELLVNAGQSLTSMSVSNAQSTYTHWQAQARSKGDSYSRMTIKDFQYQVLDGLVKAYDVTKVIVKVVFIVALLWYFFVTCR